MRQNLPLAFVEFLVVNALLGDIFGGIVPHKLLALLFIVSFELLLRHEGIVEVWVADNFPFD
jgi:hypothetical protein